MVDMIALLLANAIAAEPLHLDVGTLTTPLLDGFQLLSPYGCEDPRVTWEKPPTEPFWEGDPDALIGDGSEGGVLRLKLEPGTWDVWVQMGRPGEEPRMWAGGDPYGLTVDGQQALRVDTPADWTAFLQSPSFSANPRPVFRPGESAWDRQVTPAFPWRHVRVEVSAAGLQVAPFGRPLLAMVAWPAARDAEAEVDLALVDAAREAWWHEHIMPSDDDGASWVVATPGPLGAQVGTLDDLPDPRLATAEDTVSIDLARDDRTSKLIYVFGGDGPGDVHVDAPADLDVSVSEASWLDAAQHQDRALQPRPTVLWPGARWEGGQALPPALLVTVRSRPDSKTGVHDITLTLTRAGQIATVRLDVRVHGTVAQAGIPTGLFTQVPPEATLRAGYASDTVLGLVDEMFGLMAADGFDAATLRYAYWPNAATDGDKVDTRIIDHALASWARLGGKLLVWSDPKVPLRPAAYGNPDGPIILDHMVESTRQLLEVARDAPLPLWFHIWEEEAGWKRVDSVARGRQLATAIRRLGPPGIKLLGTAPTPADWPIADSLDAALLSGDGRILVDGIARARTRGAATWAYNLNAGASGPLLAWASGADAFLQWHAGAFALDPFNAVSRKPRFFLTALGPDGHVHSTVLLEDMADGRAQARLLGTLDARKRPTDLPATALIDAARASLIQGAADPEGRLLEGDALDALRSAVLAALDRVPKAD